MAAVGGILFCSRIGFVTPMSGNGYEMKAIAACVLGGVSLLGGVGTVVGSAIGAVIMASISYLLVFMGFSSNYDNAITGIILIVIVVVDALIQHRSIVKNRHARLEARVSAEGPALDAQAVKGGEAR
jgi:AI-2 transport system permease protein